VVNPDFRPWFVLVALGVSDVARENAARENAARENALAKHQFLYILCLYSNFFVKRSTLLLLSSVTIVERRRREAKMHARWIAAAANGAQDSPTFVFFCERNRPMIIC